MTTDRAPKAMTPSEGVRTEAADSPSADEQYRAALEAVTSPAYQHATAGEKQETLWGFISKFPYEQLPSLDTTILRFLIRLLNRSSLKQAFDVDEDVRPPRTKAFHPYGAVAKARFVPADDHPFTGIFATGAVGFVRLSLAIGEKNYGPSSALKFLIDGPHRSESLVLDQSLDTQTSRDFFERGPSNRTLWPTTRPLKLVWPLVQWWLSAIADPLYQPLDHLAAITGDGRPVDDVSAPKLIYLYAAPERHTDPWSTEDFREMLAEIPADSVLYRVYGRMAPASDPIRLGTIETASQFVASEFGDRILAFRHTRGAGSVNQPS